MAVPSRTFNLPIRVGAISQGLPNITIPPPRNTSPRLHRRTKARTSLRRTRPAGSSEVLAVLDFVTPLSQFLYNWDIAEIKAGRRLVRFWSVQDGHRLIVSCERITPEQFRSCDTVVSCIYREDVNDCFITSVDIISLLQKLVGEEFAVMEKNRIRRNLEGLRPTTVSKHRPGVGTFFQRIMEFPDPKPRNIEKDLKVFPWTSLDQALEKIISKYVSPHHISPILSHQQSIPQSMSTVQSDWQQTQTEYISIPQSMSEYIDPSVVSTPDWFVFEPSPAYDDIYDSIDPSVVFSGTYDDGGDIYDLSVNTLSYPPSQQTTFL
jgi:hypothetical protein